MKIRLYGTPAEVDEAVEALREVFHVHGASRPYPSRGESREAGVRVYLTAQLRPEARTVVVVPPAEVAATTAGETVPAAQVRVTDRVWTEHGWHRVVRVEPPTVNAETAAVFLFTEPDAQMVRWMFLPDAPVRRRRVLGGGAR